MKAALLLFAAASLGAVGCSDNDISLSILQLEVVSRATGCMATAQSSVARGRGLLDVSLVTTSGYMATPVVRNNLTSLVNGVEYNSIQMSGANVKLTGAGGGSLPLPGNETSYFYGSAAGRLDPGGLAAMFIEAVPAVAAKALQPMIPAGGLFTVVSEMRPVGMRQSDQVIGGPISLPVDLCDGCLVTVAGACPLAKGTVASDPCFVQQDDPSTCCTMGGSLLCNLDAPVAQ